MTNRVYDVIGIGIGPFNLSLAALLHPIDDTSSLFFDKAKGFDWHPGMMLESAHLQTPFMSDLVTLADPTHHLSFLNYAKQHGRLYSFYIRENFFLMRKEYNQYCQWAARQLSNVQFNHEVTFVNYIESEQLYRIQVRNLDDNAIKIYWSRKLVLGTGQIPDLPQACQAHKEQLVHSSSYLMNKATLQQKDSITLVGSGQSAAEIFYDLLQDIDELGYQLNWITRSPRFFPLEYSKLTLEMTSPEYVDYFYSLPQSKRDQLISEQKHLYKGINTDLINDIFDLLYTKRLSNDFSINLMTNSDLNDCHYNPARQKFELKFQHLEQQRSFRFATSGLIMASGYRYRRPAFLDSVLERIRFDGKGRYQVARNYSIDKKGNELFVQNAELHSHGFVTPDLGMACYRNSYLIREITGEEIYPIEQKIAFQDFDVRDFKPALNFQKDAVA